MSETLLAELKRYVGWSAEDERALRALHVPAAPRFTAIADVFYETILHHDGARQSLVGGEVRVGNLKLTLQRWLDTLLSGPWDEAYFEARCRIGRVHVRIGLPQHYMFGAMNVVRRELDQIIGGELASDPAARDAARRAVGRILDLELAVMLHTYREDLLAHQARQERLATFGQLVASIGHDLRNPLGVIETSLYILRGRVGEDERARKHVGRIEQQLVVANGIITNLLDIVRNRPLAREPVRIEQVVRLAAEAVARPGAVSLEEQGLGDLPAIPGDAGQLRQVFVNLLDNAVQAASPSGNVWVRGLCAGAEVEVAVEDDGPGVDEGTRRRLFEPLITTRERGVGGLALVKRIVERHGGTVAYGARAGGRARFTVRLPAQELP
jgi:signal transduction histidine kinase